jgi:hypothetical protein
MNGISYLVTTIIQSILAAAIFQVLEVLYLLGKINDIPTIIGLATLEASYLYANGLAANRYLTSNIVGKDSDNSIINPEG